MNVLHIVKTAVGADWAYQQVRVLRSLGLQIVVAVTFRDRRLSAPLHEGGCRRCTGRSGLPEHTSGLLAARAAQVRAKNYGAGHHLSACLYVIHSYGFYKERGRIPRAPTVRLQPAGHGRDLKYLRLSDLARADSNVLIRKR